MALVTIRHWYDFHQKDGATEVTMVAECPWYRHRTSAAGSSSLAVDLCVKQMHLERPLKMRNTYTADALKFLGAVTKLETMSFVPQPSPTSH